MISCSNKPLVGEGEKTCITSLEIIRVLQRSRTTRMYVYACVYVCVCILRNLLTQLWGMASLKSARQVGRLETQGRGDITVLNQKAAWRQNFFFK